MARAPAEQQNVFCIFDNATNSRVIFEFLSFIIISDKTNIQSTVPTFYTGISCLPHRQQTPTVPVLCQTEQGDPKTNV
jgi:hypothetical protein